MNVFRALGPCSGLMILLVVGLAGCGNDSIAYVEGTVTLDDEPLEGALVTFYTDKGRPSFGRTDANGWYELHYNREEKGAQIGTHTVEISTELEAEPDADEPELQKGVPERVPAKYNVDSELTAEVESGSNEFNFDLSSEGKIISHEELLKGTAQP